METTSIFHEKRSLAALGAPGVGLAGTRGHLDDLEGPVHVARPRDSVGHVDPVRLQAPSRAQRRTCRPLARTDRGQPVAGRRLAGRRG